ncbi:MAG: bifunctional UDP-sugar hydrolase/5'-nucleotidase [Sandaracinaceae bacterium]|nr:bifunctional UDP-sugar hydrolase/5'-nucleotidase [Sandaracinaceae bacterium]
MLQVQRGKQKRAWLLCLLLGAGWEEGCGASSQFQEKPNSTQILTIVGTNDLHGHIEVLPAFAGYVRILRRIREADGGGLLLLDAGDMFQGTLASNLSEGAVVVAAYEKLGYDAVAIGNHEFDFGPLGPLSAPRSEHDDPWGALRARVREAPFPFLSSNLLERQSKRIANFGTPERPSLPHIIIERSGIRIGIVGASTRETLRTTLAANVKGLELIPPEEAIPKEAIELRNNGAHVVVALVHAGGKCERFEDPRDASACDPSEEIMHIAQALPSGLVDVIVGGHTHQAMAHLISGIAIIESYAYGQAFGRIDLVLNRQSKRIIEKRLYPPTAICRGDDCTTIRYEGHPIEADPEVQAHVEEAQARVKALMERPIGPVLVAPFWRRRDAECPLGNLFVDLMREAHPQADVAIYNGGGLRADLPKGPLSYGALFEAIPFDNRFAHLRLRARDLAQILAENAQTSRSHLSISGIRARFFCEGPHLRVQLKREDGSPIRDDEELNVVTSDFLATGGDGIFAQVRKQALAFELEEDPPIREAFVQVLSRKTELNPSSYQDPSRPRIELPGPPPIRCAGGQ